MNSLDYCLKEFLPDAGRLGTLPANYPVAGRAAERERSSLVVLEPGQPVEYNVELSISEE